MNKILDFFNRIMGLMVFLIALVVIISHFHHAHHRDGKFEHGRFMDRHAHGDSSIRIYKDSIIMK